VDDLLPEFLAVVHGDVLALDAAPADVHRAVVHPDAPVLDHGLLVGGDAVGLDAHLLHLVEGDVVRGLLLGAGIREGEDAADGLALLALGFPHVEVELGDPVDDLRRVVRLLDAVRVVAGDGAAVETPGRSSGRPGGCCSRAPRGSSGARRWPRPARRVGLGGGEDVVPST
jgi:hypothetical protein